MFREAQKNIMELNQQRLKAMEELKAARSRIESLETELTEAKSLNESLSGQMGSLRVSDRCPIRRNARTILESTPQSIFDLASFII